MPSALSDPQGDSAAPPGGDLDLGAAECSFGSGTLRLGGIQSGPAKTSSMRAILDATLPPGALPTELEFSGGFYGHISDDMDWTDAQGRLRGVTRLQYENCCTGSLPSLLSQLPRLADLSIKDCNQYAENGEPGEGADGEVLLPALAPLAGTLTRLSLAGTRVYCLDDFPPLPGALAPGGPASSEWACACMCARARVCCPPTHPAACGCMALTAVPQRSHTCRPGVPGARD